MPHSPISALADLKVPLSEVLAHSFKDFHAKGLDYLCLERSPTRTRKVYILDGDVTKLPEAVNPHDHRYHFSTTLLAGRLMDMRWKVGSPRFRDARRFDRFSYMTPLNGGRGFTFSGFTHLRPDGDHTLVARGQTLQTRADLIHTIRPCADQTVLLLEQGPDVVALDRPTSTFLRGGDPRPDTSGLYARFTPDQATRAVALVNALTGANITLLDE